MRLEFELILDKSRRLDLMQLIPLKFHDSELLKELINELNLLVGGWLQNIQELIYLQNPDYASLNLLYNLAKLIGVEFPEVSNENEALLRKEIRNAIDWYKLKGTYAAMEIALNLSNITVNFGDLYTKDYASFVEVPFWWAGDDEANPMGLSSEYYKSPHFRFEVVLGGTTETVVSSLGSSVYYWQFGKFDDLKRYIHQIRPINTVPHFGVALNIDIPPDGPDVPSWYAFESGDEENPPIILGELVFWPGYYTSGPRFDERFLPEGREIQFDESGWTFDMGNESIIARLHHWTIGTGNDYTTVEERFSALVKSSFDIESPALTLTKDSTFSEDIEVLDPDTDTLTSRTRSYCYDSDYAQPFLILTEYKESYAMEFFIPETDVIEGISEMAWYDSSGVIFMKALFPNIDKSGTSIIKGFTVTGDYVRVSIVIRKSLSL